MSDAQVLGNELRDAREARDLSLEKVEQQTRIRVRYLEALERGDYAAFQSPVQASGFLRNYARFLSLDADELVERYNAVKSGRRRRRATRATSSPTQLEPPPDRRTQTVQGVLTELPPPPAPPEVAHERRRQRRSNLLIGSVAPNTVLQYQGTSIQVPIENAGGVRAVVNGKDLGIMGSRGQFVDQPFPASGAIPATPGPAPQGTASALNGASQIAGQASITSPGATFSLTARPRVTVTASVLPTITPSPTYTRTFQPNATPVNTATSTV